MNYKYAIYFNLLLSLSCMAGMVQGQMVSNNSIMTEYMSDNGWFSDQFQISSAHTSDHNGVTYFYLQQYHDNREIHKATGTILVRHEVVHNDLGRMLKDYKVINSNKTKELSIEQIIYKVAEQLKYPLSKSVPEITQHENHTYLLSNLSYAKGDIVLSEIWNMVGGQQLKKAWKVDLNSNLNSDHLSLIVNSQSGLIEERINHTVNCKFHDTQERTALTHYQKPDRSIPESVEKTLPVVGGGSYRVFAPPTESPIHGPQVLVEDPANSNGSPFGWHDTNGQAGAEFTITRGNNVHAYDDIADMNRSEGGEPNGGSSLNFDFDFNPNGTVFDNLDADLTNLFYWNNYMHDWTYQFGFNESAGNFQSNNYSLGGAGSDFVFAETLDGADIGNANFSAPRDGENGAMQMYRWLFGSEMSITAPNSIADTYRIGSANFGPFQGAITSGNVVSAFDGVTEQGDVCQAIVNGNDIAGNIALVDRGLCEFSFKVYALQNEGAIACIVCNNIDNDGVFSMGAGDSSQAVIIPAVLISKEDCALLKAQLDNNIIVLATITENTELSSAFDNGIVAHEYGHGISLRLTGGRNSSNCLSNDEQMGEGWSDFFALVTTQQEDDLPTKARGIGSYALTKTTDGPGIRRYQYSTDMAINPQVHSHIRASQTPHPLGEIWTSALWDMYWLLIQEYEYDPTWTNRNSGNFIAMQLVIDGMKIQGCNAGLLKARDAIITADQLNNLGNNECLIWQAFARRGMGFDAIEGNPDWRYDNVDGFELPSSCRTGIEITRTVTPIINVGDDISVDIRIDNHGGIQNGLILTDFVRGLENQGVSFEDVISDNIDVSVDGPNVTFNIGTMEALSNMTVSYSLNSNNIVAPDFDVFDNFEGLPNFSFSKSASDVSDWGLTDTIQAGGLFSLAKNGGVSEGEAYAEFNSPLSINSVNKLIKFDHRYNAQLGLDGGIVEVSIDNGNNWQSITQSQVLVNSYQDEITHNFRYTNLEDAFTGVDTFWKTSIVDLSEFEDEDLTIRFKYVEQEIFEIEETEGWRIDNFEVYDRVEIIGSACLNSVDSQLVCDVSSTFVNSNARTTSTAKVEIVDKRFELSPNPTFDQLTITMHRDITSEAIVSIISSNGRHTKNYKRNLSSGVNSWQENVHHLVPGIYLIEIRTEEGISSQKFIKQ